MHWHSEKLSQVISEVFNGVDTYLQRLQDCCFAHRWDAMPEVCISYLSFLLSLFCKSSLSTQIDHFETIFLFLIIRSQTGLFTLTLTVHICMQIHQRLDKSRIFVVVGAFTVPILPWNDYFFVAGKLAKLQGVHICLSWRRSSQAACCICSPRWLSTTRYWHLAHQIVVILHCLYLSRFCRFDELDEVDLCRHYLEIVCLTVTSM